MGADLAEIVVYIVALAAVCVFFSGFVAVFAWIGRTLAERRISSQCAITRRALPASEGDLPFLRHLNTGDTP
jgi:hypothetical protein